MPAGTAGTPHPSQPGPPGRARRPRPLLLLANEAVPSSPRWIAKSSPGRSSMPPPRVPEPAETPRVHTCSPEENTSRPQTVSDPVSAKPTSASLRRLWSPARMPCKSGRYPDALPGRFSRVQTTCSPAPRSPRFQTIPAPSHGTSGKWSSLSKGRSACLPAAIFQMPPDPRDTSPQDYARAAEDKDSSHESGDWNA